MRRYFIARTDCRRDKSETNGNYCIEPAKLSVNPTVKSKTFTVCTIFGTRPEAVKIHPVLKLLEKEDAINSKVVFTGQQTELGRSFISELELKLDADLYVCNRNNSLVDTQSKMMASLNQFLSKSPPDAVMVQGDTASALAATLTAKLLQIPVLHIEAGLRTGNFDSPFPEELNRSVISRIADLHFAPTAQNVLNLRNEGIPADKIILTGNTVVDAIKDLLTNHTPSATIIKFVKNICAEQLIVLTAHRRENFSKNMPEYFEMLATFVEDNIGVNLVFPKHPNPALSELVDKYFARRPRIHVIEPLNHHDFIHLLQNATVIVSDSGGIQEEVATLGKPLLIIRDVTERPEAVRCGIAKLTATGVVLREELNRIKDFGDIWTDQTQNPFGDGQAAPRIVRALKTYLANSVAIEH